ncbi:MAG: type II toxin-antitoxin system VapC family toxin [Planctomycetia bacterium]|nr:type II toxin-antitoxin system VapC family toxin [Planctomycetia bacterium]
MKLIDAIPIHARVGLDTAPLIYWLESDRVYQPILVELFNSRFNVGLNTAITSVVSLAEVLVKPLSTGQTNLVTGHRTFLMTAKFLSLSALTPAIAEKGAELRARHGLRLPDAFQIAAALEDGASIFLTNDVGHRRVTEIPIVVLRDFLPPNP